MCWRVRGAGIILASVRRAVQRAPERRYCRVERCRKDCKKHSAMHHGVGLTPVFVCLDAKILHFACRHILQNEFRKQAILLRPFTVVSSRLFDASNKAWYHQVVF